MARVALAALLAMTACDKKPQHLTREQVERKQTEIDAEWVRQHGRGDAGASKVSPIGDFPPSL
jgi:hypothetical protein